MRIDAALLEAATLVLYLSAAVAAGANMGVFWLADAQSAWAGERLTPLRRCAFGGALLALLASVAVLWLESAAMAEVPLSQAMPAVSLMLGATHYGVAWSVGAAGLAAAALLPLLVRGRAGASAAFGALAAFWFSRSMVSHASASGDTSLPLLVDWLHLVLINVWLGAVIIAAFVALAGGRDPRESDRRERAAYVAALSTSATIALAGIFITGLASAWRNLASPRDLLDTDYGNALFAKLVFVGVAVLLGGFNRFAVMPSWLASESAGRPADPAWPRRFRRVLQIETLVLVAALIAAVILAATPPPGAAM